MANDESGGFSKNFVPRKEVTVSDTEPADAKEGDWWYDTSNDTMRFYTGSAFVSPGNAFDGTSITQNSNDALQVSKPSQAVIGDFETDLGQWSEFGPTYGGPTDTYGAENGSFAHEINAVTESTGYGGIERTVDLTPFETLALSHYLRDSIADDFQVRLDGTVEYSQPIDDDSGFNRVEIDISQYSGETTIRLGADLTNTGMNSILVDYIVLKSGIRTNVNGAGGTI